MVRETVWRRGKYTAKIDPTVVQARFAGLKDMMVQQTDMLFADLVAFEEQTKGIVEEKGVPTITIPWYLNVARQLYRLSKRFTGKTLDSEASVICDKWVQRGLDKEIVSEIAKLYGITYPPPY